MLGFRQDKTRQHIRGPVGSTRFSSARINISIFDIYKYDNSVKLKEKKMTTHQFVDAGNSMLKKN